MKQKNSLVNNGMTDADLRQETKNKSSKSDAFDNPDPDANLWMNASMKDFKTDVKTYMNICILASLLSTFWMSAL